MEQPSTGKLRALYAPQAQGTGKTYFGENLRRFVKADPHGMTTSLGKKLPEFSHHLTALATTRSFVVKFETLYRDCESLEQAITVSLLMQIFETDEVDAFAKVRTGKWRLKKICETLLATNNALVLVLDDIPDLNQDSFPDWFSCQGADLSRAKMKLIQEIIRPLLPLPGMVVYMTGRSPDYVYKLLTTNKESFAPGIASCSVRCL